MCVCVDVGVGIGICASAVTDLQDLKDTRGGLYSTCGKLLTFQLLGFVVAASFWECPLKPPLVGSPYFLNPARRAEIYSLQVDFGTSRSGVPKGLVVVHFGRLLGMALK